MMVVKSGSDLTNSTNPDEQERERLCYQLELSWVGWELVPVKEADDGEAG